MISLLDLPSLCLYNIIDHLNADNLNGYFHSDNISLVSFALTHPTLYSHSVKRLDEEKSLFDEFNVVVIGTEPHEEYGNRVTLPSLIESLEKKPRGALYVRTLSFTSSASYCKVGERTWEYSFSASQVEEFATSSDQSGSNGSIT